MWERERRGGVTSGRGHNRNRGVEVGLLDLTGAYCALSAEGLNLK